MFKFWNYILVLIWLSYLLSSGIYLFSKGFLLSRVSQTVVNSCHKFEELKCRNVNCQENEISSEILKNVNASFDVCLPKKSKVIFIVIDALKYEFGLFNSDLVDPLPYQNKLPVINDLLKNYPENSRLLKFLADPPTTTLQRLKGMMTGSLPTFIDIGSNFATPEINEDNLIDQIVKNNLSAVFMGDSTWTELFPKRFKREYGYPSFNIYDLDTVDNNIKKVLPSELEKNDWDLLIAHFLGVDHCGHKYGPNHPEMSRKLNEMNLVIEDVIEKMDNDTILIVAGDHGMTKTGDHGGDSEDETNALFFLYSKQKTLIPEEYNINSSNFMQQIDLVPTLSSILGIPIPFSNLGAVQYHLLPDVSIPGLLRHEILLLHTWQNTMQMYKYFTTYASTNKGTFKTESVTEMEHQFIILSHRANTIYTEFGFRSFAKDLNIFLNDILKNCRDIWITFDANLMSKGLLIVFLTILSFFLVVNNLKVQQFNGIFTSQFLGLVYLISIGGQPLAYLLKLIFVIDIEFNDVLFYSCAYSFANLIISIFKYWPEISENWDEYGKKFSNKLIRIILIFFISIFFSNSFIVEEQKILLYLLSALILLSLNEINLNFLNNKDRKKFQIYGILLLGSVVILRWSYKLFKCREEQKNCMFSVEQNNNYMNSIKRPTDFYDIMTCASIALFTTLVKMFIKNRGNLSGQSINVMFFRYAPTLCTICISAHFILSQNPSPSIRPIHLDGLAWVVYIIFIIQIIILIFKPLLLFVLPPKTKKTTIQMHENQNVIPEIFNQMKKNQEPDNEIKTPEIPIVYGLATVYSSVLITFGAVITLLFGLLLGSNAIIGLLVSVLISVVIGFIGGMLKGQVHQEVENYFQPRFITLISYIILIHYTFYATAHQPTLSQIEWKSAFIGRTVYYNDSNILSGILVVLNTFCGEILFLLMYPLLAILPILVYLVYPKAKQETNVDLDLSRGELNLFEVDYLFFGAVFKIGVQLILLQGARIFCSMLACTIHCRHLMVWKIFAPRFIYEGISTYISLISIIFGFILIVHVHNTVEKLLRHINKKFM